METDLAEVPSGAQYTPLEAAVASMLNDWEASDELPTQFARRLIAFIRDGVVLKPEAEE